ncbi:3-hydroxy-3-methylglutaryl CoA reductase 2 [Tanacetum coccineum]
MCLCMCLKVKLITSTRSCEPFKHKVQYTKRKWDTTFGNSSTVTYIPDKRLSVQDKQHVNEHAASMENCALDIGLKTDPIQGSLDSLIFLALLSFILLQWGSRIQGAVFFGHHTQIVYNHGLVSDVVTLRVRVPSCVAGMVRGGAQLPSQPAWLNLVGAEGANKESLGCNSRLLAMIMADSVFADSTPFDFGCFHK